MIIIKLYFKQKLKYFIALGISILILICCLLFLPENDKILKASGNPFYWFLADYDFDTDNYTYYLYDYDMKSIELEEEPWIVNRNNDFEMYDKDMISVMSDEDIIIGQVYHYQPVMLGSYLAGVDYNCLQTYLEYIKKQEIIKYLDIVGGNNLVRDTSNEYAEISWTGWGIYPYELTSYYLEEIKQGGIYTISAYVENRSSLSKISLIFIADRPDYTYNAFRSDYEVDELDEGYISYTFTVPADYNYSGVRLGFFASENLETKTIRYKEVKLEVGDIATHWTPAPYDIYQEYYKEGRFDGYMEGISEEMGEMGFWELIPNTVAEIWNNTVIPIFNYSFFGVKILDIWTGLLAIAVAIFILKMWVL